MKVEKRVGYFCPKCGELQETNKHKERICDVCGKPYNKLIKKVEYTRNVYSCDV